VLFLTKPQKSQFTIAVKKIGTKAGAAALQSSAVETINQTAADISGITDTVGGIAFQANLLALNASIEAAKAGNAGAGVTTVATEVRTLARRCAEAVTETKALLDQSVQAAKTSTDSSIETTADLGEIMQGVSAAADLIHEIANASREQAAGIEKVNDGLQRINAITQSNAEVAVQGATSSEQLFSEAQGLRAIVSHFKLHASARSAADHEM
jgi:methyl-accepting chemotaxis protein